MRRGELRTSIQAYRRRTGHTQQELARALGLHPDVLSHKLHGKGRFTVTVTDVKRIIKALAAWGAFTTQREVVDLLGLAGVPAPGFTTEEWRLPPLDRLPPEPPATPPAPPAAPQPRPLPSPVTRLIGRERECEVVCGLLADARLLTLTGPGGIGKTRLALQAATDLRGTFHGRVAFVSLAAIHEAALVLASIAHALRVEEAPGSTIEERIASQFRERDLLLVLDTFEHLLPSAAVVSEFLAAVPGLKVIVTSRARLGLYGEYEFRVPALGLPTSQSGSVAEVVQSQAVQLFVQRARAARPDFELTAEVAGTVAQICARLEGIPLAIELAAARIRGWTPRQMLAQLSNRLTFLTAGPGNLPDRQQTLKNTLDWSYRLLTPDEQRLFVGMAVFDGSFAAPAVATVHAGSEGAVLKHLVALVDKSLLEDAGHSASGPRFRMLDTIREYAQALLVERGAEAAVRQAHAAYFLALAEEARPELIGPQQTAWLDRLESEHNNLRSALGWVLARGQVRFALRLAGALWRYWMIRGHLAEGQRWLTAALAAGGTDDPALRAVALRSLGNLLYQQADYEGAQRVHEEALTLHQMLGDSAGVAAARGNLGLVAEAQGDDARAARLYAETLALYRELGDTWAIALTLGNLGNTAYQQGTYVRARELLEESLTLFVRLGDWRGTAAVLANLGKVALTEGDYAQARQRFTETLRQGQPLEDKEMLALALEGLAAVVAQRGASNRAAWLWGAAEALREAVGLPLPPRERPLYEREIEGARAQIDAATWDQAWQEGRESAPEVAASAALSAVASADGGPSSGGDHPPYAFTEGP
jgi:predicted ATPase/Tfp pilus assembly protein PilF